MRVLSLVLRTLGSLTLAVAVVSQLQRSVANESAGTGHVAYVVANFFSFFTIESNVMAIGILALGAAYSLGMAREPAWFGTARAAVTTYMVVTGIVYNLLLRGIELPQGTTVGWSNEILHVVGPLIVLLDWLLFADSRRLPRRAVWWIVAFPIAWVAYTLLRGAVGVDPRTGLGWYPYPFLNPDTSANGYSSVVFYVLLIAGVITLAGLGVVRSAGWRRAALVSQ